MAKHQAQRVQRTSAKPSSQAGVKPSFRFPGGSLGSCSARASLHSKHLGPLRSSLLSARTSVPFGRAVAHTQAARGGSRAAAGAHTVAEHTVVVVGDTVVAVGGTVVAAGGTAEGTAAVGTVAVGIAAERTAVVRQGAGNWHSWLQGAERRTSMPSLPDQSGGRSDPSSKFSE